MKIKVKEAKFEDFLKIVPEKSGKLRKPSSLFRLLVRILAIPELLKTRFSYTKKRMDEVKGKPCLILMNHSSFLDLKIASKLFFGRRYFIITTSDGFVGKEWLMRKLGCIPTKKFTTELSLVQAMKSAVNDHKGSILLFPEASYTFDGCATPLPKSVGTFIKTLKIPVVTVITKGAFLYQPLYNNLRIRKTKVSAEVQCLLNEEEIAELSAEEINEKLFDVFTFDGFQQQIETKTVIDDPNRAEGLHRVLYRCPRCLSEGTTKGEGTSISCSNCGTIYDMDVYGRLKAREGVTEFEHIPDWFKWERACVKTEIEGGAYRFEDEVDVAAMADFSAIYRVGTGRLTHSEEGFFVEGCDGALSFKKSPLESYGLYADYNWYELGDIVSLENQGRVYYCFPKKENVVAKLRFAAEELYKIKKAQIKKRKG